MRRAARKARKERREEKAAASRKDREEIFEVGEAGMSLEELADALQVDPSDIVRSLFMKGIMLSMNQVRGFAPALSLPHTTPRLRSLALSTTRHKSSTAPLARRMPAPLPHASARGVGWLVVDGAQVLDKNTCKLVASEYEVLVVDKEEEDPTAQAGKKRTEFVTEEDIDDLTPRPPVVTVMGHVDHGQSLLPQLLLRRPAGR